MADHLASERVIVQSPTSFVGSARRIWRMTWASKWLTPLAVVLIVLVWIPVAVYTLFFGVLLVPWRLVRRGARKRKQDELRHREMLAG